MFGSVPWTLAACCTTCPTFGGALSATPRPMANYLATADEYGNVISARCSGGTPVSAGGYYQLAAMEYYVR